jgi:hypothetical protein
MNTSTKTMSCKKNVVLDRVILDPVVLWANMKSNHCPSILHFFLSFHTPAILLFFHTHGNQFSNQTSSFGHIIKVHIIDNFSVSKMTVFANIADTPACSAEYSSPSWQTSCSCSYSRMDKSSWIKACQQWIISEFSVFLFYICGSYDFLFTYMSLFLM